MPDSNVLLGGMIALFVGTFVWLTWLTHARFGSFGFDLGIFDQGVWLLPRFRDPFVTIRGLPLFGDHGSYILVLVAPCTGCGPTRGCCCSYRPSAWPSRPSAST